MPKPKQKKLCYQCVVCKKLTAGRLPLGGDGSFMYPRQHSNAREIICEGVFREAKWIET